MDVPPGALKLIGQLLGALNEEGSITLLPAKREFTTVEAANFLNVSRPFVTEEIEQGRLHQRLVGTHRRVAFEDLVCYDNKLREKQATALDALADNARELGLDY